MPWLQWAMVGLHWPGYHHFLKASQPMLMCIWFETTAVKPLKILARSSIFNSLAFLHGMYRNCHPHSQNQPWTGLFLFWRAGGSENRPNWYLDKLNHFMNRLTSHYNEPKLKVLNIFMCISPKEFWLVAEVCELQFI